MGSKIGEGGAASIRLTILRQGDTHIVDLAAVDPLIPRSETRVEKGFLDDICAEMERVAVLYAYDRPRGAQGMQTSAGNTEEGLLAELQGLGRLIFSHLLTQPAREQLKNAASCDLYLRLDDQLVQVPWELCFDGTDFLATKFRVGRQVITQYTGLRSESVSFSPREKLKILIVADPTESLPGVTEEVEQLCSLLDEVRSVEVTLLGGRGVKKIPLLSLLSRTDVVHFAGHSVFNAQDPRDSGWLLHEGVLTASEISKLDRPPLLVFSNSCQAGTTTRWQEKVRYEGEAFGLGSAFLLAGVRSFIGTFWPVHDAESLFFATAFYRSLVSGQTLGSALLQARIETVNERGWDSLTWGSYMLYGDPAAKLLEPALGSRAAALPRAREHPLVRAHGMEPPTPSGKVEHDIAKRAGGWLKTRSAIVVGIVVVILALCAGLYWRWQKSAPVPEVGPPKVPPEKQEFGDDVPPPSMPPPKTPTVQIKRPPPPQGSVVKPPPTLEKPQERPTESKEIPPPPGWDIRK
jgi:hypothetical protein